MARPLCFLFALILMTRWFAPVATGDAPGVSHAARLPQHSEAFLLEDADGGALALIVWRRLTMDGEDLLERETLWRGGMRILHDEHPQSGSPRLIWRELPIERRRGRSWLADIDMQSNDVQTVHWGTAGKVHGNLQGQAAVQMPLALIEELRTERGMTRRARVLDPLSASADEMLIHVRPGASPRQPVAEARRNALEVLSLPADTRVRTVTLIRADGSIAQRTLMAGGEVLAFQFQDGGAWAQRITTQRWQYLAQNWGREVGSEAERLDSALPVQPR
jgi:hypothetical protein